MRLKILLFFSCIILVAAKCPTDPFKDNCPKQCSLISDNAGCTLCVCPSGFKFNDIENDQHKALKEVLKVKTKFEYFNATFTWTVEQLQLFNFGQQHYDKRILESPFLTAIDYSDGNKVYAAKIKIVPHFYHNDITLFELKSEFIDNESKETIYSFQINNNATYMRKNFDKSYFSSILDDIEITVKAVFSKNVTENDLTSSSSSNLSYDDEPTPLGKELIKMFKTDSESVFTIECAGEEITAFKPVMKARSIIFKDLLSNDTDRIRITDFEPKIVKKMIQFCHNDSIENFDAEETSIFTIAYKYKIHSLMSYASKKIAEDATIDNAIARFKFAHFYGYEKLKKWYFKYIIENFSEVAKTKSFKSLDDELYKPILEELINQNKIS